MVKIININGGWIASEDGSRSFNILSSQSIAKIKFGAKQSLKGVFPNDVILDIVNLNKPTDIFYHGNKLFVSYKIVQILLKYNTDSIELFPGRVLWNGDEYMETSFFLMKIMGEVDYINR